MIKTAEADKCAEEFMPIKLCRGRIFGWNVTHASILYKMHINCLVLWKWHKVLQKFAYNVRNACDAPLLSYSPIETKIGGAKKQEQQQQQQQTHFLF